MHRTLWFALALALALPFAQSRPARAEEIRLGAAAIAASVRDSSGKAVAGALVVAEGPTLREATTGTSGVVTLQALPAGTYSVRVTRAGYAAYATQVTLPALGGPPVIVRIGLATAAFADLNDAVSSVAVPPAAHGGDPYVAHALGDAPDVDVVRAGSGSGLSAALQGTSAAESRFELDGIPIAGGPAGFAAIRFRNATALDDVEIAPSPADASPAVRDSVGGIVNYRTPAIERGMGGAFELGYDSSFGSYQHVRYTRTFGALGLLADAVTGGGENRFQNLKLRYALSNATSLGFASYGSQSTASIAGTNVASVAPAYAADLRTGLGTGTLSARWFASESRTAVAPSTNATPLEDARVRGVQLRYELPSRENLLSIAFDRRSETATPLANAPHVNDTFTTLTARANVQLSRLTRLEFGDAYTGGTSLARRNDPHVALAWRAAAPLTVRLAAGSAFATAPQDVVASSARNAALLAPETSFGYRLGADVLLGAGSRAWTSAFRLRRFDTFGSFAQALSSGIEVGYEATPTERRRLGGVAWVDLTRSRSFGAAQPLRRVLGSEVASANEQLPDIPYSKARVALSYRADVAELQVGTTWLGANNALTGSGTALGDASLAFPLAHVARVRIGIRNAFGVRVRDPFLGALYAPHEFTLVAGPSLGP